MKLPGPDTRGRRTLGAAFMISLVISVFLTAFFQTQVVHGEQYATRSEENRLQPIAVPAPRGTITDRNGEIVATSVTSYSVKLLPAEEATVRRTLRDLAPFLGLSGAEVARLMEKREARPHALLDVSDDATYAQVAAIEERRSAFPNLIVTETPRRHYPAGPAVAHVVGYVAEADEKDLARPEYRRAGYEQGRSIGKAGIEKQHELSLSGEEGSRFVEVDAMGRVVAPRSAVGAVAPVPGKDLKLTLDLGLQKYVREIFPDTMRGAVVAMVPSTGEVLALYSNPSFDPNDFVGGIPADLWRALGQDSTKPLLNRAIGALYPPASTFKLVTAAAGLEKDLITAGTEMPIPCNGGMRYGGRYFGDWYGPPGFGSLDLLGAIQHSCNVYFYQLGIRLGLDGLAQAGTAMGFNRPTGIDLPGEKTPTFPTGSRWYRERFGWDPTPSEVLSLAIGQGPNAQTVLKVAQFYSAVAGNGKAPEPHLVAREGAGRGPGAIDLDLSREDMEALWAGLARVTEKGGTAYLSSLERWKLYGKTGTAQNSQGEDHGWFAGFAGPPGKAPEVVVVAIVEHGLHGSDVAPIAAKAAQFYLDRKHGLPVDRAPTLIERLRAGRTSWAEF
ncbi:MAG TPA: penicillin-binding protein 2 [Longimicrobiaceae bacterium]|nr:penicillin-binding protein 2 [Longimicrobiaceae bacterium]